jgi:hypothetical protein
MKRALVAALLLFTVIEGVLFARCLSDRGSIGGAFLVAVAEPATMAILVDFTFFGAIVFAWMVSDARKRGKNGWLWLPLMILLPTVALAGYLLARGETKDI